MTERLDMIVSVHLGDDAVLRFNKISEMMGIPVKDLVQSAAEEAALDYFRHCPKLDPARKER